MTYSDYGEDLAKLLHSGKLQELITRSRDLVDAFRTKFGEEHEETARALNGLSFAYHEMGDCEAAIVELKRACEIQIKVSGEHSPQFAEYLCNLARVNVLAGRLADAEPLVDRAITIIWSLPIDQRGSLLSAWISLSSLRSRQGQEADGERLLFQSLRLAKYCEDFVNIFYALSCVHCRLGKTKSAERMIRKAMRFAEGDPNQALYAQMMSLLGVIQFKNGDIVGAQKSQVTAIEILKRCRPDNHADIFCVQRRLANLDQRDKKHRSPTSTVTGE